MPRTYIRCEFPEPFGSGDRATLGGVVLCYEVGDDGGAVRQIEIYANGNCLVYDRDRHTDRYGGLAEGELLLLPSDYPYTLGFVGASEFESLWAALRPINR